MEIAGWPPVLSMSSSVVVPTTAMQAGKVDNQTRWEDGIPGGEVTKILAAWSKQGTALLIA
jgi:hypothetical protein